MTSKIQEYKEKTKKEQLAWKITGVVILTFVFSNWLTDVADDHEGQVGLSRLLLMSLIYIVGVVGYWKTLTSILLKSYVNSLIGVFFMPWLVLYGLLFLHGRQRLWAAVFFFCVLLLVLLKPR